MTEKEFKEKFKNLKNYKHTGVSNCFPVDMVKEVRNLEEVEKLLKENWILINTYTNTQSFIAVLGRKG
ncbi:MAG: hypothetical protein CVU99_03360 [Firmicutes bacterium HGW-Firmicutes-4]|jgi:hypothetical protein|nr:MAG: hypothetical protein CVU99_03360 [Firmicutes bacterium HGW-Firmicutes-4]